MSYVILGEKPSFFGMVQNYENHLYNYRQAGRPSGSPLRAAMCRGDPLGRPKSVKIISSKMNHVHADERIRLFNKKRLHLDQLKPSHMYSTGQNDLPLISEKTKTNA